MFAIYLHILKVLAKNIEGATIETIVAESNGEFVRQQIGSKIVLLEKEGYVILEQVPGRARYKITDKALLETESIAYERRHAEETSR